MLLRKNIATGDGKVIFSCSWRLAIVLSTNIDGLSVFVANGCLWRQIQLIKTRRSHDGHPILLAAYECLCEAGLLEHIATKEAPLLSKLVKSKLNPR